MPRRGAAVENRRSYGTRAYIDAITACASVASLHDLLLLQPEETVARFLTRVLLIGHLTQGPTCDWFSTESVGSILAQIDVNSTVRRKSLALTYLRSGKTVSHDD